jgi:hypothetical protein
LAQVLAEEAGAPGEIAKALGVSRMCVLRALDASPAVQPFAPATSATDQFSTLTEPRGEPFHVSTPELLDLRPLNRHGCQLLVIGIGERSLQLVGQRQHHAPATVLDH